WWGCRCRAVLSSVLQPARYIPNRNIPIDITATWWLSRVGCRRGRDHVPSRGGRLAAGEPLVDGRRILAAQPDFRMPGAEHRPSAVAELDVDVCLLAVGAHGGRAVGVGVSQADTPFFGLVDADQHFAAANPAGDLPVPRVEDRAHPH